jgi:hypothetical protein
LSGFTQTKLNNGLVAWYPFNGNANDESGKGNNPVSNNATLTADRFGNPNGAYLFNGESNFIRIKNSSSLCPEEMTLVAVIKPLGFYNGLCYNNSIIDKGSWDYRPGCYALRFTAGEYTKGDCRDGDTAHQNFVGMAAANPGKTSQDIYVKPNTWYYIIFTINNQYGRLYIDGEMISSFQTTMKIGKNKEDLFLGKKDNEQYPYWFNGVIDEIRIYNKALTFDEVTELYTELSTKQ